MAEPSRISVIGLGYVGLPLALARHYPVAGYDRDARRVAELQSGLDRTREVAAETLEATTATSTTGAAVSIGAWARAANGTARHSTATAAARHARTPVTRPRDAAAWRARAA